MTTLYISMNTLWQVINRGCRGPSYLCSEDGVVWIWNLFTSNLYLFLILCKKLKNISYFLIFYHSIFMKYITRFDFARIFFMFIFIVCICFCDYLYTCLSIVYQQRVLKTFSGPVYLCCKDGSLTMAFTGKFEYTTHHFILLRLNPFDLSADREGWWFVP